MVSSLLSILNTVFLASLDRKNGNSSTHSDFEKHSTTLLLLQCWSAVGKLGGGGGIVLEILDMYLALLVTNHFDCLSFSQDDYLISLRPRG